MTTKARKKPQRKGKLPLTPDMVRFLAAMREVWPAGGGSHEAARQIGKTPKTVERWRSRRPDFKAAMDALKLELDATRQAVMGAIRRSQEPATTAEGLDGPLLVYIDVWRRKQDRKEAWEAAGMTWRQIQDARATNPAFEDACQEVEEELRVAVEDAHLRKGIETGTAAAASFLKMQPKPRRGAGPADRRSRVARLREGLAN